MSYQVHVFGLLWFLLKRLVNPELQKIKDKKRDRENRKRQKQAERKAREGRRGRKRNPGTRGHGTSLKDDRREDGYWRASEFPQEFENVTNVSVVTDTKDDHFGAVQFEFEPASSWPRGTEPWKPTHRRRRNATPAQAVVLSRLVTRMAVVSMAFIVNQRARDQSIAWGTLPENPMFRHSENTPLHQCMWVLNNEMFADSYQQPNCTGVHQRLMPNVDTWFLRCQLGNDTCQQEIFPHYRRPVTDEVTVRARRAAEINQELGLPLDPDGKDDLRGFRAALQAGLDHLPLDGLVSNATEVTPVDSKLRDELASVTKLLTDLDPEDLVLALSETEKENDYIDTMKMWMEMASSMTDRYSSDDFANMEQVVSYLQSVREAKADVEKFEPLHQEGITRAAAFINSCCQGKMTEDSIDWEEAVSVCWKTAITANQSVPVGFTSAQWERALEELNDDVILEVSPDLMMADQAGAARQQSEAEKSYPFGAPHWTGGVTTTTTPTPSTAIPILQSLPHVEQIAVTQGGAKARVMLPWTGETNEWVVEAEPTGAIVWKPRGTMNMYQEEAKVIITKDVSGTLIRLSELVEHIAKRSPKFVGDPGNLADRQTVANYRNYGLYSPFSVFKAIPANGKPSTQEEVDLGHHNRFNGKIPLGWKEHFQKVSQEEHYAGHYWLASDQVLHMIDNRAQKCKHKLESSIYLFHPQDVIERGRRFLGLVLTGLTGLLSLTSLGASAGSLSASHANAEKIQSMGKGMTVITARVSHLEQNEMIVAHAHEALLQAFYKVARKVSQNQKKAQVGMFRDLLATLVDEACYEGDEIVQELEILREHRLPLTMVDPDTLQRALLEVRSKVRKFDLQPAFTTITEMLMVPAKSVIKAHKKSDGRLLEEFARLKKSGEKSGTEELHTIKLDYLMQTKSLIEAEIKVPLVQTNQQKYFRVNQLDIGVLRLGQDIYTMTHPDFLLQPASSEDRHQVIQTTWNSLERDCMLFGQHEHLLCPTMEDTSTDGCLKALMQGETKRACRERMTAHDQTKPFAHHIDHHSREAIVFVPTGWDLELSCPGIGSYANQTWLWKTHEAVGLHRVVGPRDYCAIKISSALAEQGTSVTLAFIPEAIHHLFVAAEPIHIRRLLQLVDMLDKENKAMDPHKYAQAMLNVTRMWHQRENVSLAEVLAYPSLKPWDMVDLSASNHKMFLFFLMLTLGTTSALLTIGACWCYKRTMSHSRDIKSSMKRDKLFQQESAAAAEMTMMMPVKRTRMM